MRFGPAVVSLAAWFDAKKLFYSLALLSLILVFTVVREHRDIMSTMDALASLTTVGGSFLASPPQMPTAPSYLEAGVSSGQAPDLSVASTSRSYDSGYDWQRSTEENYRSDSLSQTSGDGFVGDFKKFRRRLDRSYHNDYVPARQALQDTIIRSLFETEHQDDEDGADFPALLPAWDKSCEETYPTNEKNKNCPQDDAVLLPEHEDVDEDDSRPATTTATATASDLDNNTPWIVFTAGVYGAGKSHTIQSLQDLGCFPPRSSFVGVDPDEIRRKLPEFSRYNTDRAGALTQKEAGMVAELLTDVALSSGKNVVVDGSLRDATWHEGYFRKLRSRFGDNTHAPQQQQQHPQRETDNGNFRSKTGAKSNLRIGILYVTAPTDEIYQRVEQRGASTGRSVPPEFLERSMREVPGAIERLKPLADFFLHVHNSKENNGANTNTNTQTGHRWGDEEDNNSNSSNNNNNNSNNNSNSNNKGKEDLRLSKPSNESLGHLLRSEIEGMIFQEKCRSIVGY